MYDADNMIILLLMSLLIIVILVGFAASGAVDAKSKEALNPNRFVKTEMTELGTIYIDTKTGVEYLTYQGHTIMLASTASHTSVETYTLNK
jgi:hypothetical protein